MLISHVYVLLDFLFLPLERAKLVVSLSLQSSCKSKLASSVMTVFSNSLQESN